MPPVWLATVREVQIKAKGNDIATNSWGESWRVGRGEGTVWVDCVPQKDMLKS